MGTVILRIGIIILGVFLLSVTFSNYVRGKLREKATFLWGILAIAMILSGAVPVLSGWSKRFNDVIYIAPFVIIIVFVCIMFYITKEISVLRRKNQELAMHVSLLNQENERILKELTSITGKDKSELCIIKSYLYETRLEEPVQRWR